MTLNAGARFSKVERRLRRRGAVLITAMWVVILLAALVLVFARTMRVEVIDASNRIKAQQAAAIEQGAEQYVLSLTDGSQGDPTNVITAPGEALQVGDGYFWLLQPADSNNLQTYVFGLTDEGGKLNLNTTTADELNRLPPLTSDVVDAIIDWIDPDSDTSTQGAESDYYQPLGYTAKNGPLETVEELMLVKGFREDSLLLWGYDRNHNGVIDPSENALFNSANGAARGIAPFVTVYTVEPNTAADGTARVNINGSTATSQPAAGGGGGVNNLSNSSGNGSGAAGDTALRTALGKAITSSNRLDQVMEKVRASRPFKNIFDFQQKVGLTTAELGKVADYLTATPGTTLKGLVNVNTAPREVLMCLGDLEESDADALLAKRSSGADTSSIAWVADALQPAKAVSIGGRITTRSYQYSADILAVAGDGSSFRRERIVVDARQSPPKILYRKDLTDLGWPLDPALRDQLRSGNGLQTISGTLGRTNTTGGAGQ